MEHAASFTGHRPRVGMAFDLRSARTEMLERHLDRAVELLVRQQDVRYFLCSMASGFDLFAAQRVLRLRYGLDNRPPMTQREVARKLGISRSYVSRLEKHAIERLREEMGK